MALKSWIKAARLRTLPLAVSCTIAGTAVALINHQFDGLIFTFALVTTILLQVLSNFANDYGDFQKGTDQAANRADRALASGEVTPDKMKKAMIIFSVLSFISGCVLLGISFALDELILLGALLVTGIFAIWAAIKYTSGANAYGYKGLGDVFVFLFFGFVGVLGTQFLYIHTVLLESVLMVLVIGSLSTAVLNLNNMRDINSDELAGKITVPVRLGFKSSKTYHFLLFLMTWAGLLSLVALHFNFVYALLLFPFLIHVKHLFFVSKCETSELLDPELKKIALSTFLISLITLLSSFF